MSESLSVRRITPEDILLLNQIDMSYTSDFGYRLRYLPGTDSGSPSSIPFLPAWKVELSVHRFDPPFERTYEWDWSEVDGFADRVKAGDVWAAFLGANAAGVLELRRSEWNHSLWIQSLYVDAAHRREGIGSLLLQTALAEAECSGAHAFFVETQVSNGPAIAFYLKHGFTVCGFNDHLYTNDDLRHDEVALFLVREISSES